MDDATRARLHDLTLEARRILTEDARGLLEGVYGLHRTGRFEPVERLPAVGAMPEVAKTRAQLERFLADEAAAGLSQPQAVEQLVKEVAFTHLNRLVALKMLEARKLIHGTLDRYHTSNGFLRYLAEPAHAADYAHHQAGELPQDLLGEGPRDIAYRHFLLWQSARLAEEIQVLFDPDNLASRLFPRPRALHDLANLLNGADIAQAWAPESEETTGWVYQYFNEQDKAEIFERLRKKKQKVQTADVPAATQLFTPRWIVKFLVHNTLGRTWMQMHPDSRLSNSLEYLVPLGSDDPPLRAKPVWEITVLDPACGTMHFGLVAFDLLAEMYREELEMAGQTGWPEKPSVANSEEIPSAIVKHNLHGIDIDLRAVQLSALALYLKAKSINPRAILASSNLACADVRLLNDGRVEELLRWASFKRPILERLIKAFWKRLQNASVGGSLVRVETEIADLIRHERIRYEREGRQLDLFGTVAANFEEEAAQDEFWGILETQLLQAFDQFAREQARLGRDESYFVGEAEKGLRILDILLRRYDIVVANPPYMSRQNMNPYLAKFLESSYPKSKGDLYAAFIERCAELLAAQGRLGMITQQSFMFVSSYEKLRGALCASHAVETMCHVGTRAFAEISGEKVNTTLFVLRQEQGTVRRQNNIGTYFRLVREPDATAKQIGFERALEQLRIGHLTPVTFRYRQGDFAAISGAPWVYWITPGLRRLFAELPKLGDIAPPKQGLATADNFRFLRLWWEVGLGHVARGCSNARQAQLSGKRWFPYMKGGTFRRWQGNQEFTVNWKEDGAEIKEHICFAYPYLDGKWGWVAKNTEYYFRRGITFPKITSGSFSARISPGGFIFDVAGSSLFPDDVPLVLGVMNSSFASFALELINPTVNFQVGDLARLPLPVRASDGIRALVERAIELAEVNSSEDETAYAFVAPPSWETGPADVRRREIELAQVEREIDEEVYRLYDISPEDRAAIKVELSEPMAEDAGADVLEPDEEPLDGSDGALTHEGLAYRWISYAVGVVLGRFSPSLDDALGRGHFPPGTAAKLRKLVDPDGVATLDPGHPDDLAAKVEQVLEIIWGEEDTARIVEAVGGSRHQLRASLRAYLQNDFFRWHVQLYRKRPAYWLFQSPRRSYGYYLFHERITPDTLYLLQGNRYLESRINSARAEVAELRRRVDAASQGGERRRFARELDARESIVLDLEAFAVNLARVTSQANSRGEVVGWRREPDDGVLLNLAPLHSLVPSWSAEPKKAWESLLKGEYDWSHTAMRYWPDRVLEACERNKSYAIAHGRLDLYAAGK